MCSQNSEAMFCCDSGLGLFSAGTSNEPVGLHKFSNNGCQMSMQERCWSRCRLPHRPWRVETGGSGTPTAVSRRAAKPFLSRPLWIAFLTFWTRQFLSIPSRTRARAGSNEAQLTKYALESLTRAVLPQFTCPVVSVGLAETQHQPHGTRHSRGCPKDRRDRQPSYLNERPPCFLAASAPASAVK